MNREERGFDLFLRLYVEHEESLRGFVRSLVPTLEDGFARGDAGCGGGAVEED